MNKTLLAALFVAVAAVSQAGVVYDNYGSGMSYDSSNGWVIGNDGSNDQWIAAQFTLSQATTLTNFTWSLQADNGLGANLTLALYSDSAGLPGGLIATDNMTDPGNGTFSVNGSGLPTFSAGTYWFALEGTIPLYTGWAFSNSDTTPFAFSTDDGASWSGATGATPVFEIDGNAATPGPAALLPFGASLLGLALRRRKV